MSVSNISIEPVVSYLFPTAPRSSWEYMTNGDGSQQITRWDSTYGAEPSDSDLMNAWIPVQLILAKQGQTQVIAASYLESISQGFTSSALGSVHTYQSTPSDQFNLTACIVQSLLPGNPSGWTTLFWCGDSANAWNYVSHTPSQIQQVGNDLMSFMMSAKIKQANYIGQIQAATTIASVQAIVWS